MEMNIVFEWLNRLAASQDGIISIQLGIILVANILDMTLGWINAKFNKDVEFKSGIALNGIVQKMGRFVVICLFIPMTVLVPYDVGVPALIAFLTAYIFSEFNSIFSHLGLTKDGKDGSSFIDFLTAITKGGTKK